MEMTESEFVRAFEDASLPNESFHHRDHVRLTWIYLRECGESGARSRLVQGIQRFAAAKGKAEKYHHTITLAWIRLVEAARASAGECDFDALIAKHPELLDKTILDRYYSAELLQSNAARQGWVEPDKMALPPS